GNGDWNAMVHVSRTSMGRRAFTRSKIGCVQPGRNYVRNFFGASAIRSGKRHGSTEDGCGKRTGAFAQTAAANPVGSRHDRDEVPGERAKSQVRFGEITCGRSGSLLNRRTNSCTPRKRHVSLEPQGEKESSDGCSRIHRNSCSDAFAWFMGSG